MDGNENIKEQVIQSFMEQYKIMVAAIPCKTCLLKANIYKPKQIK